MSKFKTYYDEEEKEYVEFVVFLIHGHSEELHKLERFIKDELEFNVVILKDMYSGKNILNKLKDALWYEADCAIALMSPDDKLSKGNSRARQNVIYELGYCQGFFEYHYEDDIEVEPVIIIKERSIDFNDASDLLGLDVLEYTNEYLDSVFHKLGKHLNEIYYELGGKEIKSFKRKK